MNDQGIMFRFMKLKQNICCTLFIQVFKREGTVIWELSSNFIRIYIYLASSEIAILVIKILNASELLSK